jgi:hypothetical protein
MKQITIIIGTPEGVFCLSMRKSNIICILKQLNLLITVFLSISELLVISGVTRQCNTRSCLLGSSWGISSVIYVPQRWIIQQKKHNIVLLIISSNMLCVS